MYDSMGPAVWVPVCLAVWIAAAMLLPRRKERGELVEVWADDPIQKARAMTRQMMRRKLAGCRACYGAGGHDEDLKAPTENQESAARTIVRRR